MALWYEPTLPATAGSSDGVEVATEDTHGAAEFDQKKSVESDGAAPKPEAELHFNLWRDLPAWINWLDVGFLLSNCAGFSRFYLYVPATLGRAHFSDLSVPLMSSNTLNAVFNDVVTLGPQTDTYYQATLRRGDTFSIFRIDPEDVEFEDWEADNSPGTRIVFTEKFCAKLASTSTEKCYLRFRLALVGPTCDLFSSEVQSGDKLLQAVVEKLELTEFRLNERRSYPHRVAQVADGHDFKITVIHYFLIRDLSHQLLEQHAPFKKVRRLEPDIWTSYLSRGDSARTSAIKPSLVSRFVIYHWKSSGRESAEGVEDFIAFASFRTSTAGLLVYAFGILLLGAAGDLLADISSYYFPPSVSALITPAGAIGAASDVIHRLAVLLAIIALAILVALFVTQFPRQRRWFRETYRSAKLRFLDIRRRWLGRSTEGE